MEKKIIDLSFHLEPATPVYPDYQPLQVSILETTEDPPNNRRSLNSSRIAMGLHCGTHMDAPSHFVSGAPTIDEIPLRQCSGPALLIRLPEETCGGVIEVSDLEAYGSRLEMLRKAVLDTGWRRRWGQPEYFSDHPVISGKAAKFLVECGVHLIGVDMPSVDRPPFDAHLEFLRNNVLILENLTNLEEIPSEVFELIALPLKLKAREASPVRAIGLVTD